MEGVINRHSMASDEAHQLPCVQARSVCNIKRAYRTFDDIHGSTTLEEHLDTCSFNRRRGRGERSLLDTIDYLIMIELAIGPLSAEMISHRRS